ncbi:MAG: Fe-S cluster assembly protein SufD [Planctomycetota bacterium]
MSPVVARPHPLVEQFAAVQAQRSEPAWLKARRQAALERFQSLGFPTKRDEAWKYTSVAPIAKADLTPADPGHAVDAQALDALRAPGLETHEIVLVDGVFRPEVTRDTGPLPDGVLVQSLAGALESGVVEKHLESHPDRDDLAFAALNAAYFADGVFVFVPKNVTVEKPVHIVHLGSRPERPQLQAPRILIVAETSARVQVLESYGASGEGGLTDAVTEVFVGANARVDHVKLQLEDEQAWHVAAILASIDRDGTFDSHSISIGGAIARNDIRVRFEQPGGSTTLNGLFVVHGEQLADHHTVVDHRVPHCTSRELYKGVLDEKGHGVFDGKVWVRPQAQKTDSVQTNKNLVLSKDAVIDTKPQLEIYADDVRCAHGATIGQIDEDALYYLRARGIGESAARSLLTRGFATDVLDGIEPEPLRAAIQAWLVDKLPGAKELEAE